MFRLLQRLKIKFWAFQLIFLTVFGLFVISCSNQARGPVAMAYHNTTAHYNAYFLGRERMKELEMGLYLGEKNNYNRILNIFPKVDCTLVKSNKDKLDKIIKNVSLIIQWHKPSHWNDDAYLVLGKVRYYDMDYENAVTTFKFINNRYKDDDVKNEGNVWLMHTYMDMKDWLSARQMGDYLENQPMLPKCLGLLSAANGHYYIQNQDYKTAYLKLKVGAKYIKPRPYRARIYYILGQLAQKEKMNEDAYDNYKLCTKSSNQSSGYEMWFYAKLNMYLLKEQKTEKDLEKTFKFYNKMLKDIKNEDYKDKIYYDIATLEHNRDSLERAIDNYKKSAKNGKKSTFVKSFAYLRIAEIFYERKQDFEKAKIYYDSSVAILDKDLPEFPKAQKRQKILAEFVLHLKAVRKEDSLQALAKLDSNELNKIIDKRIKEEDEAQAKKDKEEKKKANSMLSIGEVSANTIGGNNLNNRAGTNTQRGFDEAMAGTNEKWLFYNPSLLELSRTEFARKWGNRPDEDNWRRINKEREETAPQPTETATNQANGTDKTNEKGKAGKGEKEVSSQELRRKVYKGRVPLTKVAMDTSMARLGRGLYRLGKIYDLNLDEYPNALKTYNRFVKERYEDEKVPEIMYAAYLLCKNKMPDDSCVNTFANRLLNEFPTSLYAKLVKDPDYLQKNKLIGEKVKFMYREAFEYFEADKFLAAQNVIEDALQKYPDSDFEDRLLILKAMIIGKTQSIANYQKALTDFIKKYQKTSKLIPLAGDLLAKADTAAKKEQMGQAIKRVTWELDIAFPHYFCVVVPDRDILKDLVSRIETYHNEFFTDEKLKIETNPIDTLGSILLTVKQFPNSIPAMNYWEKQNGKSSPLKTFPNINFTYFVISDRNHLILLSEKSYPSYLEFFKKNY
jgi:tetratricopeptide (TPR) repeat protein